MWFFAYLVFWNVFQRSEIGFFSVLYSRFDINRAFGETTRCSISNDAITLEDFQSKLKPFFGRMGQLPKYWHFKIVPEHLLDRKCTTTWTLLITTITSNLFQVHLFCSSSKLMLSTLWRLQPLVHLKTFIQVQLALNLAILKKWDSESHITKGNCVLCR